MKTCLRLFHQFSLPFLLYVLDILLCLQLSSLEPLILLVLHVSFVHVDLGRPLFLLVLNKFELIFNVFVVIFCVFLDFELFF